MANVSLKQLYEVGAHFGHQKRRWNPKMDEYIYDTDDKIHVFDLAKTKELLEDALTRLEEAAIKGESIIFVGTKRQAIEAVEEVAKNSKKYYVTERWLGGTLTNFDQIKKSLTKLSEMKEGREKGEYQRFTKKERVLIDREIEKKERFLGGLRGMEELPDLLVIIDVKKEKSAVSEASKLGIPVIGIVDSNADPDIDYPIPMNDDSVTAIDFVLTLMQEALQEGKKAKKAKKIKKKVKKKEEKKSKKSNKTSK